MMDGRRGRPSAGAKELLELVPSRGVAVNASIIGHRPTGLGLYATHLIRALDEIRGDLHVHTSCARDLGGLRARIQPVTTLVRPERGMWGHFCRLLWVQTALRLRTARAGILLNTMPEAILGGRVPQVTVVHDLLPLFFPGEYPRQQYYFRSLVPRVLRASRVIVADSESTRRDVVASYGIPPDRVRVIYPGYDPTTYFVNGTAPPAPGGDAYVLYVGNLLPHKNLLSLLDAVAILRRRRPVRLVIRGRGHPGYERAVRDRVETLGLGPAVRFVEEYAEPRRLRELYARAACLVMPSLHEGFGLPVLEAMACGTPVITSSTSSLPEVGGDAALQVDPHDAIDISDAMHRLLETPGLRAELRERGLRRVGAFSWRRTAEQMSRLLDEVARGRRAPDPRGADRGA
jgi:glycosyltransferase involved in cell wall biosynthesis